MTAAGCSPKATKHLFRVGCIDVSIVSYVLASRAEEHRKKNEGENAQRTPPGMEGERKYCRPRLKRQGQRHGRNRWQRGYPASKGESSRCQYRSSSHYDYQSGDPTQPNRSGDFFAHFSTQRSAWRSPLVPIVVQVDTADQFTTFPGPEPASADLPCRHAVLGRRLAPLARLPWRGFTRYQSSKPCSSDRRPEAASAS